MAFRTEDHHGDADQAMLVKPNSRGLIMSTPLQIGLVLFPRVTQLDFTGPLQVFSNVPGARCI